VGRAAFNRIEASAATITTPPAATNSQPNAAVTIVGANNSGDGARAAKRNPIAHTGMPSTLRKMKVTRAQRRSPDWK
jgi:hypothetical protein